MKNLGRSLVIVGIVWYCTYLKSSKGRRAHGRARHKQATNGEETMNHKPHARTYRIYLSSTHEKNKILSRQVEVCRYRTYDIISCHLEMRTPVGSYLDTRYDTGPGRPRQDSSAQWQDRPDTTSCQNSNRSLVREPVR